MKIGIDIRVIGKKRTGDEAVFFNLVKNLAKIDGKNEYALFTDICNKKDIAQVRKRLDIVDKENFTVVSLGKANKFLWNFWTLPNYLRKNPVDVYETQYITPLFISRRIKIVTIIHDISFNFFPQFIKPLDLFFLKILIPLSLKRADGIVAVSDFTKQEIIRYYKVAQEKIFVVLNALGDEFSGSCGQTKTLQETRRRYDLPERYVLYLGTLQPRKNIAHLIEAFARIKSRIPGIKLVIGGSKDGHNVDTRIDQALAEKNISKDVIFTGYVQEEDKRNIFKMARVFAFPSLYEGFGIPILEAMGAGVPVLANDIASLREIGGSACKYCNTSNLDEFSRMLYTCCTDGKTRKRLISEGKNRVTLFSWDQSAKKNLAMFEKIVHLSWAK